MSEIDDRKISKILGGKATATAPTTFGPTGVAGVAKVGDETKLLPCPFCGGEAKLNVDRHGVLSIWHAGECVKAELNYAIVGRSEAELMISAWNRRSPDPLARLAAEVAEKSVDYRDAKCLDNVDVVKTGHELDRALNAYVAARSSPPPAMREAELDRLAMEAAEAGISLQYARKRIRDLENSSDFVEVNLAFEQSDKAERRHRVARAAKERTGP